MQIKISDDELDYNSSKWLLEYARICKYNIFSFDLEKTSNHDCMKYQNTLIANLSSYYSGEKNIETSVMVNGAEETKKQHTWLLNHETIPIISGAMGRHLLDDLVAMNYGVSGWRFYKDNMIMAGAIYGFDYFIFNNAPNELIKLLGKKTS